MRPQVIGVAALMAVLLAGCADDGGSGTAEPAAQEPTSASPSPTASPSPSASEEPELLPSCDEVWVAGRRLPAGYQGCQAADTVVRPVTQPCAFAGEIVTYDDRFYAVRGRRVNAVEGRLKQSEAYQRALASCRG